MGEDLPFATHGGVAVTPHVSARRRIRLQAPPANGGQGTIDGIEEDEHEIEVRVDHALLKRFRSAASSKGRTLGMLIAVPEDDLEGQRLHHYRTTADEHLEIRAAGQGGDSGRRRRVHRFRPGALPGRGAPR